MSELKYPAEQTSAHKLTIYQLKRLLKRLIERLRLASDIYTERYKLGKLSDEMLDDIGISREQARKETERSFLDIPENREK